MRELYWFQNDLRLTDNPGLLAHSGGKALLLVYFWPSLPPWCNLSGTGAQRERFLRESIIALRQELRAMGQDLLVLSGDPGARIPQLVELFEIDRVGTSEQAGFYEQRRIDQLAASLDVPVEVHRGNTLFDSEQFPFELQDLPKQFTPFRQRVEALLSMEPLPAPTMLPAPPTGVQFPALEVSGRSAHPAFPVRGGTAAGQARLRGWMFDRELVTHYKETRNYLDGIDGSSLLSPWLANGNMSVRQAAQALREFELDRASNESTRWLYLELLWREFFYWRAKVDGSQLFQHAGIRGKRQLRTFEARDFARWCQGDTDYPLVNALMHQLVETGWMSNRGRQIAASCLINELNHDWRYGAAFFEKHLIDYDVGSNYGNWQYIAGVGTDPRGGRHFNLEKQTTEYDPDGSFTARWDGHRPRQPRYINDAADWPMESNGDA